MSDVEPLILGAETLVNDVAEKILDAVKTVSERHQSPIGFQSMTTTFDFSFSERIQLENFMLGTAPTHGESCCHYGRF